jgi:peptidoglycan/xylan/chitin deacetylase (PgdA/CDA1 family)
VALNSSAAERYPQLVRECRRRGYEFLGHGSHSTRMITSRMSEDEERATIGRALEVLERAAGVRPRGWHGQDFGESARTPRLLAEVGLDFVVDWPNDDQPYPMHAGKPLISLPAQPEWDDVQLTWLRRLPMTRYPDIVGEAFAALHAEGGRVFCLGLHPWLTGMAHREVPGRCPAADRRPGRRVAGDCRRNRRLVPPTRAGLAPRAPARSSARGRTGAGS